MTTRNQFRTPAAVFATDGFPLGGTWHTPAGEVKAAALFAGAMGVKSRYYSAFCDHLAEQGIGVLTVDYRGVGLSRSSSLRGFRAGMMDWAEGDLQGAVDAVQAKWPGKPLLWVAHSLGGQLMGFVRAPVRRAVFVASTSEDPCALYVREVDGVVRCLYKPNRKFLGDHDLIAPALAAWLPVLIFGPPAFVMFDSMHT